MENARKIGILLILIAVITGLFGTWLKTYNDKLAQVRINETGSCYLSDGTCLHTTSDTITYAALGIALILGIIGIYMMFHKREPKPPPNKAKDKKVSAPKILTPEARSIFDIISQSNGAILQGELVSKSGMGKVKVSRILDKLEMQGLIERKRHGMSNLVTLKK